MATSAKKKKRSKKAAPMANGGIPPALGQAQDVDTIVLGDGPAAPAIDLARNVIETETDDGMITIQFGEPEKEKKPSKFEDNLAEELAETSEGQMALGRIAEQLLEAIGQDENDRSEWLQQRADGLDLLGMKVEKPGTGNVGSSATAVAGQSTVRDALLAEACDRFQANAFAELCPSEGPCKVLSYGEETAENDKLAEDLEKDINFYLTGSGPHTAKEYYPDTRKMLWWTGYGSGMFKKVYRCPLRNRPVSESVDGADLIVPSNATDLANAGRITHRIDMRPAILKRMQIVGAYRDVDLTQPTPQPNALTQKEGTVTGMNPNLTRPEDQDYTIYESYCELDIPGFEHKHKGDVTGLPLPYRVVLDKDSRVILEIRRNWKEPEEADPLDEDEDNDTDDGEMLPVAKIPFVLFPYGTGLSIYGTGLLQRLGNYAMALTAMLRISIDSGMFANFPGFLFAKPAGRQLQNEFRIPPGGGAPIDVSAVGNDIKNAVLPLPYKPVDAAFVAFQAQIRETAARYGGTAEAPTGEGVVNAPVGSVLAAIDQATRIEGGVHKALYAAQREELGLLVELFREDPTPLWRGNKRPAMGASADIRRQRLQQALENFDLVPASDPNVPSHMHRLAKANAYLQTAIALPGVFIMQNVVKRWASMVKIDGVEADLAPPAQPGPDPTMMLAQIEAQKTQVAQQKVQVDAAKVQLQAQQANAQLEQQGQIEATKIAVGHHQKMAANAQMPVPQPPDPHKAAELDLKQQGLNLQHAKLQVDTHLKQRELDSKEAVEAFKLVQAQVVHPEAAQLANQQMDQYAPFIEPAAQAQSGMGRGGAVDAELAEPVEESEDMRSVKLALAIAQALQERRDAGYTH